MSPRCRARQLKETGISELLTLGQMLTAHARLRGDRMGVRDLRRALTFRQWNERSSRLANALLDLGLAKGGRVAILAYNGVEWAEIYASTAKAGLVAVPVNFRLLGLEVRFIVENADASALIVQDELLGVIEEVRADLPLLPGNFIHFGERPCPAGFRAFEDLIAAAPARPETKRAVMEMFRHSGLFELYGTTEIGWATMLHPAEQFTHLGSVGRECVGSAPIRNGASACAPSSCCRRARRWTRPGCSDGAGTAWPATSVRAPVPPCGTRTCRATPWARCFTGFSRRSLQTHRARVRKERSGKGG